MEGRKLVGLIWDGFCWGVGLAAGVTVVGIVLFFLAFAVMYSIDIISETISKIKEATRSDDGRD